MNIAPVNAGIAKFIIHNVIDDETIAFELFVAILKKKMEEALLTTISVSAKVGMTALTRKVSAINTKEFNNPISMLNISKTR